ncbi:head maturation protease, ClpP-related [Bacillus sp. BP-3]|uniref:head maturation protease, ClpP-related n=1 Tax=Bacillus sp. BP-3 TaxID=3022773 RepID=UPI00232B24A5|nr:head maturation protease, ClpP-related [Bacillus sp. BP-3]MDC2866520.1 Clp protease ClpP [Bacillus sp. BP-3]
MAKISIKGAIISNNDQWIYDWLDMDATSPKKVQEQLSNLNGRDLEVEINSGGGSVFAGSEIYTSLKEHNGNVTTKVVGLAASAASVVAMAGDKVLMSPTAQMMIHNASGGTSGDYRDMDHMSGILRNINETIATTYQMKTGLAEQELLSMMDTETWLTPQQALEKGFIDEIMFTENNAQFVASYNSGMLPQNVIDKIRNEMLNKPTNQEDKSVILMQQKAKLNLLKLKLGGTE